MRSRDEVRTYNVICMFCNQPFSFDRIETCSRYERGQELVQPVKEFTENCPSCKKPNKFQVPENPQ